MGFSHSSTTSCIVEAPDIRPEELDSRSEEFPEIGEYYQE